MTSNEPRERERYLFMGLGSLVMLHFSLVSQADRAQENLLWCLCFNNSSLQLLMSYYCSSCQKGAFTSQASPSSADLALKRWLWSLYKLGLSALSATSSLLTSTTERFCSYDLHLKLLISTRVFFSVEALWRIPRLFACVLFWNR